MTEVELLEQQLRIVRGERDNYKAALEMERAEFTTPSNRYPDCGRCRRRSQVMHQVKQWNHELRKREEFRSSYAGWWGLEKYVAGIDPADLRRMHFAHKMEASGAERAAERHRRLAKAIEARIAGQSTNGTDGPAAS